jgi:hypothetical protein
MTLQSESESKLNKMPDVPQKRKQTCVNPAVVEPARGRGDLTDADSKESLITGSLIFSVACRRGSAAG